MLRVQHAGESMIDQLRVNFRQYQLNNAPRSSQLRLAWVLDDHLVEDGSYTEIFADQDVEEIQPDAQFEPFCESELLSGINLMPGQTLFLRWTFDDHQGQGTRDEIGVGSITVTTDLSNRRCAGDPDGSGSPTVSVTDLLMPMATSTVVEEVPATVHPTMMESNNASSPATASTESMSVATTVIPSSSFNSDVVSTTPMNPAISTSTGVASTSTSGSSSKVSTSVDMGSSTTPIVESTPVPITSSTAEFPTISQSLPSGVSTRVETTSTSLSSSKIPTETNKPGAHSSAARNGEGGFNMILLGLMATTVVNRLILNPLQNH